MIELINLILGILPAITGGLFGVFKQHELTKQKKQDNTKEVQLARIELKATAIQLEQANKQAELYKIVQDNINDSNNLQASYEHDSSFKPHKKIDSLRASVRPVITFALVFATISKGLFYDLSVEDPLYQLTAMAFGWWFGERNIQK